MPGVSDSRWAAQGTTPGAIEAALREMLKERHAENESFSPARALNMVCVVDKAWSGEVANRLRNVGRYHASRTIVLAVDPKRTQLDAVATIASDTQPKAGEFALLRETVIVDVGEKHLRALDTIVDPLVVTDLPTVLWSPHGHPEAVDVLLDSGPGRAAGLGRRPRPQRGPRARPRAPAEGLRRRPGVVAFDALARARGGDVRPGASAPGPAPHQRGHGPPPPRFGGGRAAAHRLAGLAPGLAAVQAHPAQRRAGGQGPRQAPGRRAAACEPEVTRACAAWPD